MIKGIHETSEDKVLFWNTELWFLFELKKDEINLNAKPFELS